MSVSGFDKWAPKLKDKASVLGSSFNDLEKAVIKATRSNTKPPKEKHVRALIIHTERNAARISELVHLLCKRLEAPEWMIVMKALIVIHRLLRDAKSQFINELKMRTEALSALGKYSDMVTPEAHHQSIFVRKYARFLEEKVVVFKITKIEFERDPAAIKEFGEEELLEKLPRLQSVLNALLNCKGSKEHINNQIIVSAFQLLLKDSFRLYRALNEGIIVLLEHYFSMPLSNAEKALEIYKLFVRETDSTISFFDVCKRFARTQLPELQHAPTTLVEALENYHKDLTQGKTVAEAKKGNAAQAAQDAIVGKAARKEQAKHTAAAQQAMDLLHVSDNEEDDSGGDSDEDDELTGAAGRNPFDPFATDAKAKAAAQNVGSSDPFLDFQDAPSLPTFGSADPFGAGAFEPSSGKTDFRDAKKDILSLFSQTSPSPAASSFSAPSTGFGNDAGGFGFGGDFGSGSAGFGSPASLNTSSIGSSPNAFGSTAAFGASSRPSQQTAASSFGASNGSYGAQRDASPFDGLVDFGKPASPQQAHAPRDSRPMGAIGGASPQQQQQRQDNPFGSGSSSGGATFNPFG